MLPSTPNAQIRPIRQVSTERPPRHLCPVRESNIATPTSGFDESVRPEVEGGFFPECSAAATRFWERRFKDLETNESEFLSVTDLDESEECNDQDTRPTIAQSAPASSPSGEEFSVLENNSEQEIVSDGAQERLDLSVSS
jgi:hypothetical protein